MLRSLDSSADPTVEVEKAVCQEVVGSGRDSLQQPLREWIRVPPNDDETELHYEDRVRGVVAGRLCDWREVYGCFEREFSCEQGSLSDLEVIHHIMMETVAFVCAFDLNEEMLFSFQTLESGDSGAEECVQLEKAYVRARTAMNLCPVRADSPEMRMLVEIYVSVRESARDMEADVPLWCKVANIFARDIIVGLIALNHSMFDPVMFKIDLADLLRYVNNKDNQHGCDFSNSYHKILGSEKPPPASVKIKRKRAAQKETVQAVL